ncbi:hypothetical protein [Streptomyces sp. WAC 01325]|uniref:hypothetical protein n=1 Tax=Streptomyces sp. WAC 01325 TaxID=2203202 RepID=UPI00163C5172|nr:hypothetical protein [Streptomyces sp. WAC 01325]
MLIRPWDAPHDDTEWQRWLDGHRRSAEFQDRIAGNLAGRGGPRDVAAREHMLRRRPA